MEENLPNRKMLRWNRRDYSSEGKYFITICIKDRKTLLSRVSSVGGDVPDAPQIQLLAFGKIADRYINQLNDFYDDLEVDQYVIMPNHIHIILFVYENGPSRGAMGAPRSGRSDLSEWQRSADAEEHSRRRQMVGTATGLSAPTKQHSAVSRFVSTFKRFCNKESGANIWQRSFYDHVIRDSKDYQNHLRYICENPQKWQEDELYSSILE